MDRIDQIQMITRDNRHNVPALTTLLHVVCNGDTARFDEACRLIRLFMEAVDNDKD